MTLTEVKDRKIVKYISEGKTMREAMGLVGYKESVINTRQGDIRKRINTLLCDELSKQGLDPTFLIAQLKNGLLNASKPIVIDGIIQDYPDHKTRLSYISEVLKILDAYPSQTLEITAESYEDKIMRLHSQSQAIVDIPAQDCLPSDTIPTESSMINDDEDITL